MKVRKGGGRPISITKKELRIFNGTPVFSLAHSSRSPADAAAMSAGNFIVNQYQDKAADKATQCSGNKSKKSPCNTDSVPGD